jgi:adenylosuccinate synthase
VAGWSEDVSGARRAEDLPKEARAYLELIESLVGTRVSWASVGPGREQIVAL